jgi:ABC-type multidrug transport system fused ATPase/permease subunit
MLPIVGVAMPLLEKRLIDDVLLGGRRDQLLVILGLYGGVWLAGMFLNIAAGLLRVYFTERLSLNFRQRLFAHCEALSIEFSRRQHSGQTMSLFASDVPTMTNLLGATVLGLVGTIVVLTVGIIVMLSLNWQLALVAGFVPLIIGLTATVITRPLRPAARRAQDKLAEVNEQLHESLAGMREVVAFGQEQQQQARYTTRLNELLSLRLRIGVIDAGLQSGQNLLMMSVSLVILGYGGYLVMEGQTTLGTLIAMRSLFMRVLSPAEQLASLVGGTQKLLASADRVYAFLDERPRVQERAGARAPLAVAGTIGFENVSFGYYGDRPVLRDVSFTAGAGELVALVGPSGAGKSTLVSLIARFHDPDVGRVLLDGVDLRDLTLAGLRRQIGMVFQDTFLFAGTIGENIAFGDDTATHQEIVAAAHASHAWEFIEQMPEGLATRVGERGVRLSEGQKQRIAIARALLRDPRILILDEPTSALDARSEHLLQAALDNLMHGRTTFVIAHRLATVQRADRILVLDGGEIVEQGTSIELLACDGLYRSLYDLQFGRPDVTREAIGAEPPDLLPTPGYAHSVGVTS